MFRFVLLSTVTALLLSGLLIQTTGAEETPGPDLDDIMEELQEELDLSEEQMPAVEKAVTKYVMDLNETQAKYEDQEEPDPQGMIGDIKKVRDSYYKDLQKVLSKEQWKQYEELREEILHEIFSEIAELRIIDLKEPLSLTDEQMDKMKPVMGKSLRAFIGTIFEYGDKRMNTRNKLKLANSLKRIKSEQDSQMKKILSSEQLDAWEKMKESEKK